VKPQLYILSQALLIALVLGACTSSRTSIVPHQLNIHGIFNGRDVLANEPVAHTVVAVHSVYPGADEGTICSGTLLSSSVVLTAAHCLMDEGSVRTVLFGIDAKQSILHRKVIRQIVHPGWRIIEEIQSIPVESRSEEDNAKLLNSSWNDLALVEFEGGLPEGFFPSALLTDQSKLQANLVLTAAGFGVSDAENHKGTGILRTAEIKVDQPEFHDNEFSVQQNEAGTCDGDSGGPVFLKDGNSFLIAGLTSHGINDEFCRGTTVFTFLAKHLEWIQINLEELNHAK
jgi:secreted trypsin-like serine protease